VSVITTVKQRGEAPFGRRFNVGPREAMSSMWSRRPGYVVELVRRQVATIVAKKKGEGKEKREKEEKKKGKRMREKRG